MQDNTKQKIGILGSTGSIGKNACTLLQTNLQEKFSVEFLACNLNFEELSHQVKALKPKSVCVGQEVFEKAKNKFCGINVYCNLNEMLKCHQTDVTLHAVSGVSGILCLENAIKNTEKLAIANKESIVSAWKFIEQFSVACGTQVVPVDSEHNSLYRLLELIPMDFILKVGITASGGPFFGKKFKDLKNISPKEALVHPTWQMGIKNTIDSATMANKVLELIEAMQLFGCNEENIDVKIHRQSVVHANVWLKHGGVVSFSSTPDMKTHISHAIFPELEEPFDDVFNNQALEFFEIKKDEFPIFFLGREVAKTNDVGKFTVFNVANEIANELFCQKKILYTEILTVLE